MYSQWCFSLGRYMYSLWLELDVLGSLTLYIVELALPLATGDIQWRLSLILANVCHSRQLFVPVGSCAGRGAALGICSQWVLKCLNSREFNVKRCNSHAIELIYCLYITNHSRVACISVFCCIFSAKHVIYLLYISDWYWNIVQKKYLFLLYRCINIKLI